MRLTTGILGFDDMLQGGLPAGASVVLQGPPGQEKMRFALTFLAEGLKAGASGLVMVSSQSPDSVLAELRNLGVDLDAVVKENRLRIVDWYTQREEPVQDVEEKGVVLRSSIDLTNVGVALSRAIAALGGDQPKRAVVELLSPAMSVYEVGQVYAFAQSSKGKFVRFNFTALFLIEKDMHPAADLSTLHQPFDGVIEIERTRVGDTIVRKIGVLHMKDTTPDSAFRTLEMTDKGMHVVRGVSPSPAPAEPTLHEPTPRPVSPGTQPKSVQAAQKPATTESKEESPTRAYLIMQIARERLKLNPGDADALFAMAAAQATLDDARGALDALDRLSKIDERYPGLWVLKTKLHARMGEADRARASRTKAEQNKDVEGLPPEVMVNCPLCDALVSEGASQCPKCGARFLTETDMAGELDALGQAAIQEKVEADLGAEDLLVPGAKKLAPKPERITPKPAAKAVAPPKKVEKPSVKQGLTNGLVRERAAKARPVGMTNGLRGRTNGLTNGLRGRTNGLTNGLRGRTNGLTNGLGRTNGLTNGMGHTNGLTNGLGRTNGVTNGLTNGLVSLRRGITNGLTNGNGFTNGLGSPRFHREIRLNRWKLYVIPIVAMALLLVPLFTPPEYATRLYPIQIDGQFGDWASVTKLDVPAATLLNPNADIVRVALVDNVDFLSFYIEVRGSALAGGPAPERITDAFFVFIDTDRSPSTGYRIQGIGADRLVEIDGWSGLVMSATLMEFDANRDVRDWGGWFKGTPVQAAASGSQIEFEANWDGVVEPKAPIHAAFAARSWDGHVDVADATTTSASSFVIASQDTTAPQVATGLQTSIARFTLQAFGGDVHVTSLTAALQGTYAPTTFSSFALTDAGGSVLSRVSATGSRVQFAPLSLTVPASGSITLRIEPAIAVDDGTTVGAFLGSPSDIASDSGVALRGAVSVPTTLAYVGAIPAGARVDGAFSEWSSVAIDSTGDVSSGGSADLDISQYAFQSSGGSVFFHVRTLGTALNGTLVPALNPPVTGNASSFPDSDRDSVPDSIDPFPNDFNNDGIPDTATNGDYDGDGITDYGFPGGTDVWLNTTIPASFPAPYGGRTVQVYIGPVQRQVDRGEDVARFYLDQDGSAATGYAIGGIGADYLLELTGKEGAILSAVSERFNGSFPGQWSWASTGLAEAAKDSSRIEARIPGVGATNVSRGFFEIRGWSGASDNVTPAAPAQIALSASALRTLSLSSIGSPSPQSTGFPVNALDLAGNQQWFFTNGATTGTGCDTNRAASLTAGSSATSTTLIATAPKICWFTPLDQPDTTTGTWETIVDVGKTTDGTKVLRPNAQGDANGWSAAGCAQGSAFDCVDDNPNDGDTTYIVSNATTITDSLFNIFDWTATPAPPTPLSIANVIVEASCRKTAAPNPDVRILLKSGTSTAASGTNCATSTSYTISSWTLTTDPSDGLAWTLSDINALQVGVRDNDNQGRESRVSHVMATVTWTPVYSVQIDRCTASDCSAYTTLYTSTNSNSYGNDVTFTASSISGQTLGASERIRFQIILYVDGSSTPGSITAHYNGANPGTDDSRGTVPPIPLASTMSTIAVGTGAAAGDLYGFNVTGVGKINENSGGYEDFVVGAPNADLGGLTDRGAIYIFFGSSGWSPANVNAGSANVVIYGAAAGDHFGWAIAPANDVNGDGFADLLVGSPDAGQGKAYLIYGRSDWSAANGASIASVGSVVTIVGQNSGDKFGSAVAGLGNVDNSGNADFAVGAYAYASSQGRVYLFYGDGSIATKGVDADVRLDGAAAGDKFGFSVAGTGNVNNDAYADLIVGAPGASKAYVYTLTINPVVNGHLASDASGWTYGEVDPNGFDSGAWENTGSSNADSSGAGSYKFAFADTTSSQTWYFHTESITVNTVSSKGLLSQSGEQGTAVVSTVTAVNNGDHLLIGTWTTPSLGITTLVAGTWTFTYNADAGNGITSGHIDVHIFKRSATGTLTAIDATDGADSTDGVASSGALGGSPTDLTGTYSMASTSLATTDAVVIKVYGHAVTVGPGTKTINFNYDSAASANSRVASTGSYPEVRFFHTESATVNTVLDKQLLTTSPEQGTTQTAPTTQSTAGHYLLSEWTSPQMDLTSIPGGDWHFLYWGSSSATSAHFDIHIYKRSSSGTLTSIDGTDGLDGTDGVAPSATLAQQSGFSAGSVNLTSTTLATTDAIVVKLYAHYVSVSGSKATTFEFDTSAKNSRMMSPAFAATDRMSISSASSFTSPPGTYTSVRYRFWYISTVTSIGDASYRVKFEIRDSTDATTVATTYDSGSLTTAQAWASHTGTVTGLSPSTAYRIRILVRVYNVHAYQTPSITVNVDDVELEFEIATTLSGTAGTNFGWAVSSAGNLNADATPYKDVAVGAPDDGNGKAYIYYGSSSFDSTADVMIAGATSGDKFGYSVAAAGDATGDGIDDLVVGAPYNDNTGTDAGAVYVFAGSASLSSSLVTTDASGRRFGETANDHFGWSVSAANPDGSGITEIFAGAPNYDAGANTDAGKVYVMRIPEFSDLVLPLAVGLLLPFGIRRASRRRRTRPM